MHKVLLLFTHLTIVFSSCPPGWKELPAQAGCYYIDLRAMAFMMAEQSCQEMRPDSHLLSIHNAFQNEMIKEELNRNDSMGVSWIGFNKISSAQWEWIDASPQDYSKTCPGFPTNTGNKCAKFIKEGCWQDADCSELSAFVCGISFPVQPSTTATTVIQPTITTNANACSAGFTLMEDGYCYYASDIHMYFDDANRDCQERGAHLVSMHNYWENLIAMKFLLYAHEVLHRQAYGKIWIGFQCHNASLSSCGWTDGSRFDYSAIYEEYLDSGNYWGAMYIYAELRGRWDTWSGANRFPFVCKHRSSVVVPEASDNQLPNCNIGYWSADSNTLCYGFDSMGQYFGAYSDAYCVQIGGRFASIHNRQQNSDIYALFQTTQPPFDITDITDITFGFHFGLKENYTTNTWYWVDGTPYDSSFWASGYPRHSHTPYISAATNGLWATDNADVHRSTLSAITQLSNNICPTAVYFGMGEIRSPGFPENYAFNRTCTYTLYDMITVDPPTSPYRPKLAVYFITFVTHPLDVVEIFDGPNVNSPLIANVSGIAGAKQEYYSTGYNMTIRFTSRVGNNFKGWRAVFGPYTTRP